MMKMMEFLTQHADNGVLSVRHQTDAMWRFDLSPSRVEKLCLDAGILPAQYQRNRHMITTEQQLKLFTSTVAVVGCGGLGGYIIEELARLGVGQLMVIDPDAFEEHNLNRQLLSSPCRLGKSKAKTAAERIAEINPAVTTRPFQVAFSREKGPKMFDGVDVVVDAVDSIPVRMELAECCSELNIPLVHGAIAGWYGQVSTIFPGEDTLQRLYRHWTEGQGLEAEFGNPSFTPAVVASLEAAEVCKILLQQGALLRGRALSINLLEMEMEEIGLNETPARQGPQSESSV